MLGNMLLVANNAADIYFGFMIAFFVLTLLAAIFMIIIVLLQRGSANDNISALTGSTDSFFGKNKSRSIDGKFKLATVIVAASLVVFAILFFVMLLLNHRLG